MTSLSLLSGRTVVAVFNILFTFCSGTNQWTMISKYWHTELYTAFGLIDIKFCYSRNQNSYWPFQLGASFVDPFFLFVFLCLSVILSCLFLAALWSPAWKGLTSWQFCIWCFPLGNFVFDVFLLAILYLMFSCALSKLCFSVLKQAWYALVSYRVWHGSLLFAKAISGLQ